MAKVRIFFETRKKALTFLIKPRGKKHLIFDKTERKNSLFLDKTERNAHKEH